MSLEQKSESENVSELETEQEPSSPGFLSKLKNAFSKCGTGIKKKYNKHLGENVTSSGTMKFGKSVQLSALAGLLVGFALWLFSSREFVDDDDENPEPIVMRTGLKMVAAGGVFFFMGCLIIFVVYINWSFDKLVKISNGTTKNVIKTNAINILDGKAVGRNGLQMIKAVWATFFGIAFIIGGLSFMDSHPGIGMISALLGGLGMAIGGVLFQSSAKNTAYLLGWEVQGHGIHQDIASDGTTPATLSTATTSNA